MGFFDFLKPKKKVEEKTLENPEKYSVLNNDFKAISKQDAINRYNYLIKEQKHLEASLKRHETIIQESLNIMYSSKNLEVIKRRFDTIYENHNHIKTYKNQGYQVDFDEYFIDKLIDEYNRVIINLAKSKVNEYELKIQSLKTEKAKDNQTKKIYSIIDEINKSFKKPTQIHRQEIEGIKNRIEDIYS